MNILTNYANFLTEHGEIESSNKRENEELMTHNTVYKSDFVSEQSSGYWQCWYCLGTSTGEICDYCGIAKKPVD